jgi:hypothetical protein
MIHVTSLEHSAIKVDIPPIQTISSKGLPGPRWMIRPRSKALSTETASFTKGGSIFYFPGHLEGHQRFSSLTVVAVVGFSLDSGESERWAVIDVKGSLQRKSNAACRIHRVVCRNPHRFLRSFPVFGCAVALLTYKTPH